MDPSDGLDGLDPDDGGRPDATEVELVPVGEAHPSPPRTPTVNRKHAAIAAAALLASAVLISRAGESVPTATALRTADFSGPELTAADDDENADLDELDQYELPSWLEVEDAEAMPYDDELAWDQDDYTINTFDTYDPYDPYSTTNTFDDYGDEDYDSYLTLPRRPSSSSTGSVRPRSSGSTSSNRSTGQSTSNNRTTTSTSTTTTVAATTTTSAETTTTTSPASPTSAAATTTTQPAPTWAPAVGGLGSLTCATPLNVLTRTNSLIASVVGGGLYTNTAGTWSALTSAVVGTGEQRALVQTDADTYWIGGADGVFKRDDGAADFTEVGDLTNVRALSVYVSPANQPTMLAVAGADSTLYRWDGVQATWTPISTKLPAGAGIPGEPLVLDGMVQLLGTTAGVFRTVDGGESWLQMPTGGGVSGAPLVRPEGIYWLLAGGQGLLRSVDNGLTWPSVVGGGQINPSASRLALRSDGLLLTVGANVGGTTKLLQITPSGTGVTTAQFGPSLPYVPSGVARLGTTTYIWSSTCVLGSDAANAIMSLADS